MGLFKKKPPTSWDELGDICQSLGTAGAESRLGRMPPDYVSTVVDSLSGRFHALFAAVAVEHGPDKTRKHVEDWLTIPLKAHYDVNHVMDAKRIAKKDADSILAALLTNMPQEDSATAT